MPGGMPYHVEKGPYFSMLDSLGDTDAASKLALRRSLLSGVALKDVATLVPNWPAPDPNWPSLPDHLADDWLGESDAQSKLTTGWWRGYRGDVEAIMRETFVRAIDVSLGLDRHDPTPDDPSALKRNWPILFTWVCGSRWFEGWVGWHRRGLPTDKGLAPESAAGQLPAQAQIDPDSLRGLFDDSSAIGELFAKLGDLLGASMAGVVNVLFMTPGMEGKSMYHRPQRDEHDTVPPTPGYQDGPTSANGNKGLWVVSAEKHVRGLIKAIPGWAPLESSDFAKPWFFEDIYVDVMDDDGQPVVVSPAEVDGGVLPGGRPI